MRIAINALPAIVGAGPTFFRNFLPELHGLGNKHTFLVIAAQDQEEIIGAVPPDVQTIVLKRLPRNYVAKFVWEQLALPVLLWWHNVDVLYSQGNSTCLLAPCRKVVVITGANPYSPLQLDLPASQRIKHWIIRVMSVLSSYVADGVIFISEDSGNRIRPHLRVPEGKTFVVPFGVAKPQALTRQPSGAPSREPFVLTVSVLWPHKNLERLMQAFDQLVADTGFSGKLIIAGAPHDRSYYQSLQKTRDSCKAAQRIEFTGAIPLERITELYRTASIFVFPSIEETQGLPLLEALSYGVPVAASDCRLSVQGAACFSPFPEFAGDAAIYFDPFDTQTISTAMARLLSDTTLRQRLAAAGPVRADQFTWRQIAQQTMGVFEAIS